MQSWGSTPGFLIRPTWDHVEEGGQDGDWDHSLREVPLYAIGYRVLPQTLHILFLKRSDPIHLVKVEMQRVTEQGPKFRPVLEIGRLRHHDCAIGLSMDRAPKENARAGGAATDSRSPKMVVITFYNGQASLIRQLMGDVTWWCR